MKSIRFAIAFVIIGVSCSKPVDSCQEEWITLFNGNDLADWTVKISGYEPGDNFGNTFRVEDSLLTVSYDQYDSFENRFGHIFYKNKFSYYLISAEYRFVGEQAKGGPDWAIRNSGIMVHGQSTESMRKDQDFPISIEVQLLGGLGSGPRSTANLCTPGTHVVMADTLLTTHCIDSNSKTYNGDQWVNVKVLVLGDSLITHMVQGDTVLQYSKPQIGGEVVNGFDPAVKVDGKMLTEGSISLQSESHPVQFKNVKLLNLCGCTDKKAANYKIYYVKSNNSTCLY
jgi:hypothetical protein